jgi:hypothetical protein
VELTNVVPRPRQGLVLPTSEEYVRRQFLGQLQRFTCNGEPVSDVYHCINENQLCTDVGECVENACVCPTDREGKYCQTVKSGDDDVLAPILGTVLLCLLQIPMSGM